MRRITASSLFSAPSLMGPRQAVPCVALLHALLLGACSSPEPSPSGGNGGAPVGQAGSAGTAGNGSGGTAGTGGAGAPGGAGAGTGGAAGGTASGGAAGTGNAGSGNVPSGAPGVRFVGRVDTSDAAGARFAWSGTGVVARFTGPSLAVRMNAGQQYTVVVDGVVQPKLTTTGGSDSLATGLAPGEHTVELYRRNEPSQGESQFLGFDLAPSGDGGPGELLAPPPAPERRIELIGDSISAGYGNEGADETCGFSSDTENHYLTYGAITARNLGAELSTVAWSGKGVVCNYGDDAAACENPMPTYFDRILPNQADSDWDFSKNVPQAVVINLGTNDFSTTVDPTEQEFVAGYLALLVRVREAYPGAVILCGVGPLLSGLDLTTARTYIESAVQQRNTAGDSGVQIYELDPQDSANGLGCDYHPSLLTHQLMSERLTATLELELGW